MKKLFTLIMVIFITLSAFSQSPEKMSYQCVVRNPSGVLITNQSVGIKISILQGTPSGTVIYSETYSPNPQTNANGLVTVEIGGGFPITGTFSSINWGSGVYFLKTETDPAGGTSYTITGTSQLLSVPYALYSDMSEDIMNNTISSVKIIDGTITASDLGTASVTSSKIADGTIVSADLAASSVTTTQVLDGTLTAVDLATGSVTSSEIADATIANADLGNLSVTNSKISGSGATSNQVLTYNGSSVIWSYAPGSIIKHASYSVNCTAISSVGATAVKILDLGSFSKLDATSDLEVEYIGRIYVVSMTGTGVHYELRVDNAATTIGRARAVVRSGEVGSTGIALSIKGIFPGFGTGTHTMSLWAWIASGTATTVGIDPGCWSNDVMIVREIK
jgi:hypothetical protein